MRGLYAIFMSALLALQAASPQALAAAVEFEEDFTLPIIYLNIVVDVGAAEDPADKHGLAWIASHMLLRGTQKHTKNEFFAELDRLGAHLDIDVRNEGSVIRAGVLAENLEKFLALVEETLTKPKFTSGELTKLKKETEGDILQQKGNDKLLVQYHFNSFFYGTHPYGNPPIGSQKGVKAVNHIDVVRFYTQNYGTQTLKLFGTGAAKRETLEKWFTSVTEKLGAIHPDAKSPEIFSVPHLPSGRRTLLVDKPKTTQAQVLLGGRGFRPEDPGYYAVQLANHSYGGPSFQARMMREIRVKRGWTYGAYNTFRYGRRPRHYAMYIFPKTEDTVPAIELSLQLFEDFVNNGITRDEFEFARNSLVNNSPFNYDTSKKRLDNATVEYLMNFPRGYYRDFAKNIDKVSFDEIKPALAKNFSPSSLTLTVVGDRQKLLKPLSGLKDFSAPTVKNYLED